MPDAIVEREGQTMVITMNRPKRYNALSGQMLIRMYDAMVEASADDDIRCIIPTSRRAWPRTPISRGRACCATTGRPSR